MTPRPGNTITGASAALMGAGLVAVQIQGTPARPAMDTLPNSPARAERQVALAHSTMENRATSSHQAQLISLCDEGVSESDGGLFTSRTSTVLSVFGPRRPAAHTMGAGSAE